MYAFHEEGTTLLSFLAAVRLATEGMTLLGTVSVKLYDLVPMVSPPENVVTDTVPLPLTAFGIASIHAKGIVKDDDVPPADTDFCSE